MKDKTLRAYLPHFEKPVKPFDAARYKTLKNQRLREAEAWSGGGSYKPHKSAKRGWLKRPLERRKIPAHCALSSDIRRRRRPLADGRPQKARLKSKKAPGARFSLKFFLKNPSFLKRGFE